LGLQKADGRTMASETLRIGSRGSELALWQARWVQCSLAEKFPGLKIGIEIIKTQGDKILDSPLSKIGDKGLFTREIENALLQNEIDLAVHSLKDLPTELPKGLTIGAICEREDVRDAFIPHPQNPIKKLLDQPGGSKVATGSLRRKCQLLNVRPDIRIMEIRGNLNTRIKKLEESDWAGMILACAGVVRLGWADKIGEVLDPKFMLPAVGQGALGIEIRERDTRVASYVSKLHHEPTAQSALAERALLRRLEGGCQVPIGTYARVVEGRLELDAIVGSLDGKTVVKGYTNGPPMEAESLGTRLAEKLLLDGADEVLRQIRGVSHEAERPDADV
jgi:hydroxymethylbilane synthase